VHRRGAVTESPRRSRRSPRFRLALAALALVAVAQGLAYAPFVEPHETLDSPVYEAAAAAIRRLSYSTRIGDLVPARVALPRATPFGDVDITGLPLAPRVRRAVERQTFRTPGYPLLLAVVGDGSSRTSRVSLFAVQALLSGLTVVLLGLVGRLLWNERVGLLAAALYALDPFTKRYVSLVLTETLAGVLAVLSAYLYALAWSARRASLWGAAGLSLAALTLTRPGFAVLLPVLAAAALLRSSALRVRVAGLGAVFACAGALLGPWLVFTTNVTGRPVLTSFGAGWNLLLAAHGEGPERSLATVENDPAYRRDFDSVHALAPAPAELIRDPEAHARYLARADARQRHLAFALYRRRLHHEPATVAGEAAYRALLLWWADKDWRQPRNEAARTVLHVVDWLTIGLAAAGIALALRAGGAARGLALALVVFTLFEAVQHVEPRYGMPLRGLLLAFVALALVRAAAFTRTRAARRAG
jgi:4-amino-4-deoxy-L-arabinose transferase-like glycosyltransferase